MTAGGSQVIWFYERSSAVSSMSVRCPIISKVCSTSVMICAVSSCPTSGISHISTVCRTESIQSLQKLWRLPGTSLKVSDSRNS